MQTPTRFAVIAIFAGFTFTAADAGTLPIAAVSTHNNKDNFGGNKQDLINGSGMNGVAYPNDQVSWPPATDPAPWTTSGTAYRDEWQSGDLLAAAENPTNGKIGWAILDLGSSQAGLDKLHIWHIRENSTRYAKNFNVYLVGTPTASIPASPTDTTSVDYDFASGGWTSIATGLVGTYQGKQVVTFSEDINSSTVNAADFTNEGTSNIYIGPAITETSPGVFTIEVTPTDEGTLRLQIPSGATIADTAGNPLNTGAAILDDTTITVQTSAPSALVGIAAITGSHGGDSYANGMVSLTNGGWSNTTEVDMKVAQAQLDVVNDDRREE